MTCRWSLWRLSPLDYFGQPACRRVFRCLVESQMQKEAILEPYGRRLQFEKQRGVDAMVWEIDLQVKEFFCGRGCMRSYIGRER